MGKIIVDGKEVDEPTVDGTEPDNTENQTQGDTDTTTSDGSQSETTTDTGIEDGADAGDATTTSTDDNASTEENEAWMTDTDGSVPVATHIKMKQKLKGRIAKRDDALTKLNEELEQLKAKMTSSTPESKEMTRPNILDFKTKEEYNTAVEAYEEEVLNRKLQSMEAKRAHNDKMQKIQQQREAAVTEHYDRAEKLLAKSGIDPEVYRKADTAVREAVESLLPNNGDVITDQLISNLGEGSEKVMFYLGRNQNALNAFKVLLADDPTGLRAAIFLGEQKAKITTPVRRRSNAPKPSSSVEGDVNTSTQDDPKKLRKIYNDAHKKGDSQAAYTAKRRAKLAGINVADW